MNFEKSVIALHKKSRGKLELIPTVPIKDKKDLSLVYTPGVGIISKIISENPERVWDLTIKSHMVAVISDGSAVLGLGNIGPDAALPVMEGKCVLLKKFAGLDAFPVCLNSQDPKDIISAVKIISPVFGGIILEDIAAPNCFTVEEALQNLDIPVMHDDQHGTAVVVLSGMINAAKASGKDLKKMKIVVCGAGAAGTAIAKILAEIAGDVQVLDSKGIIYRGRRDLDIFKTNLAKITNKENRKGDLKDALNGTDAFVGVSRKGLLKKDDIKLMAENPIVFALANPEPEIYPDEAKKGGAFIVATGRSDFPNQVNNCLAFPGIFKGALEVRARQITDGMKISAANALANMVKDPNQAKIIPGPFEKNVTEVVAKAVARTAMREKPQ